MPWVLGLTSFSHAWLTFFFLSCSKGYGDKQDWTMEIVGTCGQNIEKKIVRAISCLELVVWWAFPIPVSFWFQKTPVKSQLLLMYHWHSLALRSV